MNQKEGPVRVVSDENSLKGEVTVFTEALVQGDFNSVKVMTEKPVAINGNVIRFPLTVWEMLRWQEEP